MASELQVDCCASTRGAGSGKGPRLVIIGGGSAAFAAATTAAPEAESVTIVNSGLPMGGCCVNVGCVPSKFLLQAANITSPHHSSPPFHGLTNVSNRVTDFRALMAQNEALVNTLRQEKYANVIANLDNVRYVEGRGQIVSRNGLLAVEIEVSSPQSQPALEVLLADRVILATGVSTALPEQLAEDLANVEYLTNENAYFLEEQPKSMIVLGGGYVALETAQMFARLGTKVTIIQRSARILSNLDEDVSDTLAKCLQHEGIEIIVNFNATSVTQDGDEVILKGDIHGVERTVCAERIFLATGRKTNSTAFAEYPIRKARTQHGGIVVSKTLRTSVLSVYAAGDCVAESPQYVYTAAAEGKLAAQNAMASFSGKKEVETDYSVVPWVIFTSPSIAGIGHTLSTALAQNIDAEASTVALNLLPRAIVQQQTKGFIRMIRDKKSDVVIGAQAVAEEGGELVMEAAMAVRFGVKVAELAGMFHPYLTWGEGWKLAALGFGRDLGGLSCCAT